MLALVSLLMSQQTGQLDLASLQRLIESDKSAAAKVVRQHVREEELKKGASPIDQGTLVFFAIEAKSPTTIKGKGGNEISLVQLEDNLYAAVTEFSDGDGFLTEYRSGGALIRGNLPVEVYTQNPFVQDPPNGRKGELRDMGELKSTTYPGTTRKWYIYLPANFDANKEHPVLVGQDAQWDRHWQSNALENCSREGLIPQTVGIFIEPGQDTPGKYSNRSREYDPLSPKYTEFLLNEIFPKVQTIVKLTSDPAKRALVGVSSGGICSFTACWERPDQFGVALSFIGSFANIASGESKREGGHNYPFLLRKTEKKPIRVYLQDGSNDLDNEHGNWYECNLQMASALRYKGYDHVWVPGEGFHSSKHARRVFDQTLSWWLNPKSAK